MVIMFPPTVGSLSPATVICIKNCRRSARKFVCTCQTLPKKTILKKKCCDRCHQVKRHRSCFEGEPLHPEKDWALQSCTFFEFWRSLSSRRYWKCNWSQFCSMMAVRWADSRSRRLIRNTGHEGEYNNERRETTERCCKEEDVDDSEPWCDFVTNICSSFFGNVWQVQTNFRARCLQFFMQITVIHSIDGKYIEFWWEIKRMTNKSKC